MEFVLAAAASMSAGVFTNPLEVIKTRMQLQGELKAKGQHAVYYKNVIHGGYVIAKADGLLALQKGLVPTLWVQFVMNGLRYGTYQFAERKGLILDENGKIRLFRAVLVSGTGGILGQYLATPFFLIKTHLQSSSAHKVAVGYQHRHTGMLLALKKIYTSQGVNGLFLGGAASVPRGFVSAVSQLLSFKYAKEWLFSYDYFRSKRLLTSFLASLVGGVSISLAMTPFDLVMTRIQNQPVDARGRGKYYSGLVDCVKKIYETEGFFAFYKGVGPMYIRMGPHTLLCLMFLDEFHDLYYKFQKRM